MLLSALLQVIPDASPWSTLFTAAGAVVTSGILAAAKKTDVSIFKSPFFRKIQPALTLGGALLAPWIASVASSGVDVSGFGQAPALTLATVIGAELLAVLRRST